MIRPSQPILFLALFGVITVRTIVDAEIYYLPIIFFLITIATTFVSRGTPQRAFYVLCSGELTIVASGSVTIFGLLMQIILIGLFLSLGGALDSHRDWQVYISSTLITLPLCLLLLTLHRLMVEVLVLGGIVAVGTVILSFSLYRTKAILRGEVTS